MSNTLFLSHGGGPLPLLGDPAHREMVEQLQSIAGRLKKPSAIVVISAHWEAGVPTITAGKRPPLIYDYYGFPDESYDITYPCPGEPALANKLHSLLNGAGFAAELDGKRGLDHGLFVPLKIMYPAADVPCIQLSLVNNLDPAEHIRMGQALAALDEPDILVIGSGFSFHNLRAFLRPATEEALNQNMAFEQWLMDTCSNPQIGEAERSNRLVNWEAAPGARFCHPREEHLLPLHVCYGMAGGPSREVISIDIMNFRSSLYLW